jgi:transposase
MESIYYIGLDIHKKTIAFCVKQMDGRIVNQGFVAATRKELTQWAGSLDRPWVGAMEATMFTGWVYDFLKPCALELKVAHPAMLKAIAASKKKNDRLDAEKIADLLRCNLLPECYMAPSEIRELRRVLRYRNLMRREETRMKNKTSGLLMEVGAEYNKRRLHGGKYFEALVNDLEDVPASVKYLLQISRCNLVLFDRVQKCLLNELSGHELIQDRVRRLMTIPGVGEVTALTWVLEIGEVHRFGSVNQIVSYCGLCSAQKESAGKAWRGPLSKQRNKYLQTILIEAAKLAPRWNEELAQVYAKEVERGHSNRATLEVARKLAAIMLAVDKRQTDYVKIDRRDDFGRSDELSVGPFSRPSIPATAPLAG